MNSIHYVGFDVHKKRTSYCIKLQDGTIVEEGEFLSRPAALDQWCHLRTMPWEGALEATLFSDWIYDRLEPHAVELSMADARKLDAIGKAKKKTDRHDARMLADLLRCNLIPACYVAPAYIRELRRMLRFRNLLVHQAVRMMNCTAGLLMQTGVSYNKEKLHGKRYFGELLDSLEDVPESVIELLRYSRAATELFINTQRRLLDKLRDHPRLCERVAVLRTIPGVGEVTALTWVLEVGEHERFPSARHAASYCGLTAAFRESAGKCQRGPISKQRNAHLQTVLIEAAKLAPRWNPVLAEVRERALQRGNRNQATLTVARKLVAYLLAVDRSGQRFQMPETATPETEAATTKTT